MSIDTRLQNGFALAAALIFGGIVVGAIVVNHHDNGHISVDFDGVIPSDTKCKESTIYAPPTPEARAGVQALGLAEDFELGLARICASPSDSSPPGGLPVGLRVLSDDSDVAIDRPSDWKRLEIWDARSPSAPLQFACLGLPASDAGSIPCEMKRCTPEGVCAWEPAPAHLTLNPGYWRGGCRKSLGVEPAEAPGSVMRAAGCP